MKYIYLLLLVLVFPFLISAQSISDIKAVRKGVLIVKLKAENRSLLSRKGISNQNFENAAEAIGMYFFEQIFPNHSTPQEKYNGFGDKLVDLSLLAQIQFNSNLSELQAAEIIKKCNLFEYVEPRAETNFFASINDPLAPKQYALRVMKVYEAWDIEKGDSNVVIGIADAGTDRLHIDMKKNLYTNKMDTIDGIDNDNDGYVDNYWGWDLGSNDYDPQWFPMGHGLFVSGIVSATQNNGVGVAGIAFNNKYMPIKIDDTTGFITMDYEGVVYAADHGCAIINCSWGSSLPGQFGQDIINYATFNRNALVVAACGNSNNEIKMYPASYANVLSCAGTDSLDQKLSISTYNNSVDISAPGAWVYSTWINDLFSASYGTSFAAPCVAAAAALVKSKYPYLSALQIAEQLKVTADIIDTISYNSPYINGLGSGRVNVYRALTEINKPSIVLNNCSVFTVNDTLFVEANFKNFLAMSSSYATAKLYLDTLVFEPILDSFALGSLNTFDTISNYNSRFAFKIKATLPLGFETDFRFQFMDTNYRGTDFWHYKAVNDFLNIDTNKLTLSVTNNSSFGFTNEFKTSGDGMLYTNNAWSLFSCSGLMIGNSTGKVSDNVYGISANSKDFRGLEAPYFKANSVLGNQEIVSKFNDDSAGVTSLGLEVKQNTYAFNTATLEKTVFVRYTISNKGALSLTTLYSGIYTDFDLSNSNNNFADYDTTLQMSYTFSPDGGTCVGLMAFAPSKPVIAYNFSNDGSDNSINIYDGFLDFEKYQALQIHRPLAVTSFGSGKDVSSLLSSGPYVLNPSDSIQLLYAFVVGNNLQDLFIAAQNARNLYIGNGLTLNSQHEMQAFISPNPCNDFANLNVFATKDEWYKIEIYNAFGKLCFKNNFHLNAGSNSISIPIESLSSGVYSIKMETSTSANCLKMIKQ